MIVAISNKNSNKTTNKLREIEFTFNVKSHFDGKKIHILFYDFVTSNKIKTSFLVSIKESNFEIQCTG